MVINEVDVSAACEQVIYSGGSLRFFCPDAERPRIVFVSKHDPKFDEALAWAIGSGKLSKQQ